MQIYTRTGDDGTTGLLFGGRVRKDDPLPEAYGTVDEAQAALGLGGPRAEAGDELDELDDRLGRDLWVLMAELATAARQPPQADAGHARSPPRWSRRLEAVIDEALGPLRAAHRVRGARRRPGWPRCSTSPAPWCAGPSGPSAGGRRAAVAASCPYLNRLSDLLWTLARWQEGDVAPGAPSRHRDVSPELPSPKGTAMTSTVDVARTAPRRRRRAGGVPVGHLAAPCPAARDGPAPSWPRRASRASPARRCVVPAAKRAPRWSRWASASPARSTRGRRCAGRRAASRGPSSRANTVATAAGRRGRERRPRAAAQAVAEGVVARPLPLRKLQDRGTASRRSSSTVVLLGGQRPRRRQRRARSGGADRRGASAWPATSSTSPPGQARQRPGRAGRGRGRRGRPRGGGRGTTRPHQPAEHLGGLLGVNRGSAEPPRVVQLDATGPGRGQRPRGPRRQGHHVRLRWAVAQDRRRA